MKFNRRAPLAVVVSLCIAATSLAQSPMKSFCRDLARKSVESTPDLVWRQFGPGMSGNNKAAFWHNSDPNVMFISPNMGNSYRTTDRGITYETILDEDAPGIKSGLRGPGGFNQIVFSYQDLDFGFCVDEANRGIFVTEDRGKTWRNHTESLVTFDKKFLSSIAVDPTDDSVWYIGCGKVGNLGRVMFTQAQPHGSYIDKKSLGQIWKSSDRGATWRLSNAGLNPLAEVQSMLVDPANNQIVYASTTYGFYRSSNGGKSWELKNSGLDNDVLRSFASHYDEKSKALTLYVIADVHYKAAGDTVADAAGGVFVSRDRGESWQKINGNLAIDLTQFAKDRSVKKSYVHAVSYFFGLSDAEFMKRYPKMPKSLTQRFNQVTVDPNDPDNIYLVNMYTNASRNNFMPGQIWRTKDGGKHWYITYRNGKNWESGRDIEFWKERGNPVGNNATFQYLNGWMARDGYERKSCNMTCFNADGSVLHTQMAKISMFSYDKGDTWVDIDDVRLHPGSETYVGAGSSNLPGHGFYQDLRLPNQVFCCAGENSLWVTCDGGDKIREGAQAATVSGFLDAEMSLSCYAIHPQDTTIRYSMFFRQHARGELLKSTDSGASWSKHGVAIPEWEIKAHAGDQPVHQLNLMIDPVAPDNMYFCVPKIAKTNEYVGNSEVGFGVHKSTDGGATWSECNVGLPDPSDVPAICFDPKNSSVLYAAVQGNKGGLFRSEDRGDSWKPVRSTLSISKGVGVNDIHFAVDGKVYMTAGGKGTAVGQGGLWVSDDDMKSWRMIFNYPYVFRVETAYYDANVIMISTFPNNTIELMNPGTYLSKDGGKSWVKFNKGNGQSDRVNDIAIDNYVRGKYYASTYGSGWYVAQEGK